MAMKGIRQVFGLGKKNSQQGAGATSPAKRDGKGGDSTQNTTAAPPPVSPANSTSKKTKADKKRGKKHNLDAEAQNHRGSLPGIGPLKPWDPAVDVPAPSTIVGAESITDDAIRLVQFCCEYFLKYGTL